MTHKVELSDGTKLVLPTARLSHTQVDMYLRCPRQYEIRYVMGHKEAPGWALTEGNAGHSALEHNNLHKISTGADLPAGEVIEKFSDELSDRVKRDKPVDNAGKPVTSDDIDEAMKHGQRSLGEYMGEHAPQLQPVTAERELKFSVGGIPFIGYSDLETKGRVYDYKFTGAKSKKLQSAFVDNGLQFTLYSIATGHHNVGVIGLLRSPPPKTGKNAGKWTRLLRSVRTKEQKERAEAIVVGVARAISAGSFPLCSPDNYLCTKDFCGFYPCWKREFAPLGKQKATKVSVKPPPRRRRK